MAMRPHNSVLALCVTCALSFAGRGIGAYAQDPTGRFVQVSEGLLDNDTGLIWGYGLYETGEYLRELGYGNVGANSQWGAAQRMDIGCNGDAVTYCYATYPDFSNDFFLPEGQAPRTDWRVPTRDEMVAAAQGGIHAWLDASPADGFQAWTQFHYDWSSTVGKPKTKVAFAVRLFDGSVQEFGQLTACNVICVRGAPPPAEDGPGNGKGNK